jgi:hypothetical protein
MTKRDILLLGLDIVATIGIGRSESYLRQADNPKPRTFLVGQAAGHAAHRVSIPEDTVSDMGVGQSWPRCPSGASRGPRWYLDLIGLIFSSIWSSVGALLFAWTEIATTSVFIPTYL